MSQSTPIQPSTHSEHRPLLPSTGTPRFSPYPPAALRTSLFHQSFRTPSSSSTPILSTPRSLTLPSRISTPYTPIGIVPLVPQNTPLSTSSSFGPLRTTSSQLASLSTTTKRTQKNNPFEKLSANDFDQFVNGLREKVKNALDPEVERKRRREEREERQRLRDAKEKEKEREQIEREKMEEEASGTKDVFGEIKNVVEHDDEEEEEEVESENENLVNGQQVKIDPNQSRGETSEEEESVEPEKPMKKPVEIVLLDSDEEEEVETEKNETMSSVGDESSAEEEYSGSEEIEEDELRSSSSRSPSPDSLSRNSARPSAHPRPPIEYPSLSVSSSRQSTNELEESVSVDNDESRRLSSSPDPPAARARQSSKRERSPLFRPRNEGSVSLSAPEDYELDVERDYFSQEEVDDGQADLSAEEKGTDEENHANVFESLVNAPDQPGDEQRQDFEGSEEEAEGEEDMLDLPPVSQRVKRDAFGRPIRYQEADGTEGGEFEGYEEEEGFGEDSAGEVQDYQIDEFVGAEEPMRASYGFRLEDLVEESVKEADRVVEEAAAEEPENLGTIELDDSDDEPPNETAPDLTVPSQPKPEPQPAPIDLLLSQTQTILPGSADPSDVRFTEPFEFATSVLPPSTDLPTEPAPISLPLAEQITTPVLPFSLPRPESVLQGETSFYDFRTPPEAQTDFLDVDQVRMREMERLPFLQEAENGNVFEGYEEEDETKKEKDMELPQDEEMQVETEIEAEEIESVGKGKENAGAKDDSPQGDGEDQGEYFGEDVPGDEVVVGGELDSEDEGSGSGSGARATYSEEDSEDLGPRIPYEAKGKGVALPSPAVDSEDDLSRFALSDPEDGEEQDDDDEEDPWQLHLLYDYDLGDLEHMMRILSKQLARAQSERMYQDILLKLQDVQDVYIDKGGEILDTSDQEEEEEEQMEEMDGGEASHFDSEAGPSEFDQASDAEAQPHSPDRSAFEHLEEKEEEEEETNLDAADQHARDQVLAIASQLVDLQSSSNPYPSLRIGSSSIDHPEETFSSHFRQEDAPQPKLDDPINLPPPPASVTDVNEPIESQQQDEELEIERVVADEQQPIELPKGEETTVDSEMKEQVDSADRVETQGDEGGLSIVDDDEFVAPSVAEKLPIASKQAANLDETSPIPEIQQPVSSTSEIDGTPKPSSLLPERPVSADVIEDAKSPQDEISEPKVSPPLKETASTSPGVASSSIELVQTSKDKPTDVDSSISVESNRTSVPKLSPFVPLPPSSTPSIAHPSGPDLSHFSSHFRYEPDGPPPSLDAPLNLPAPPSAVTNVDEPIIREQQDEELEPEIQVSNEAEIAEMHNLSEMVDLSHDVKPKEANDFEESQPETDSMMVIDDDEPVAGVETPEVQTQEKEMEPQIVEHRSRIGATPPPPSTSTHVEEQKEQDSMIVEGSAPPQNPALTLSTPPRSPSPSESALPPPSDSTLATAQSVPSFLTHPAPEPSSLTSAADEIRFDDIAAEDSDEASPSISDDEGGSEAEIAHELLSPHKILGGVLGFAGGADEFGETIVMNSDSEEEEEEAVIEKQSNGDQDEGVEELDLDSVKMALRRQNELDEEEEEENQRQVSEPPSSEPISYASSNPDEESSLNGLMYEPDNTFLDDFGGGPEEGEVEELPEVGDLGASPTRAESSSIRIHDVLEPGEWDPSRPIEFGTSTSTDEVDSSRSTGARDIDAEVQPPQNVPIVGEESDVVAVVEMSEEDGVEKTEGTSESTPIDSELSKAVAESVVEALAAETESIGHFPFIEVDPEVIEEALHPTQHETSNEAQAQRLEEKEETTNVVPELRVPSPDSTVKSPSAAPPSSESGDEVILVTRPSRRSRPESSTPREIKPSTIGRRSLASDTLEVPSPVRRSSRLSSTGPQAPSSSAIDSPSTSSPSTSSKGKRSRKSDESSAEVANPSTPIIKKARRSGHPVKYVIESEEPAPPTNRGSLRVHHHHHHLEANSTPSTSSSSSTKFEPPLTRSRCHFTRLKVSSVSNQNSLPYEFLVPACALTSPIAIETMKRSRVENLGPIEESMHCRGTPLGGRGFDSDAAKVMDDRHPRKLVPDEDVLDVVLRIVGSEIFDEGEVELLPRQVQEEEEEEEERTEGAEDEDDREEGEIEEGQVVE
ncbi:uncharacterized protein JCM6883_002536 [Sporobolomyces salmoneus]|uniref:uncharacterized protein n=1 Tax=Sporobolomyces salmoneus TaxID=183962 RepID=UPI0031707447